MYSGLPRLLIKGDLTSKTRFSTGPLPMSHRFAVQVAQVQRLEVSALKSLLGRPSWRPVGPSCTASPSNWPGHK